MILRFFVSLYRPNYNLILGAEKLVDSSQGSFFYSFLQYGAISLSQQSNTCIV